MRDRPSTRAEARRIHADVVITTLMAGASIFAIVWVIPLVVTMWTGQGYSTFVVDAFYGMLLITIGMLGVTSARFAWRRVRFVHVDAAGRPLALEVLIQGLAGLAGTLAGRRHAHLREAWAADLYGDPDSGDLPPPSRRLRLAVGDVRAAFGCRLDDAADLAWRPVDGLLASWHGSNLATFMPVIIAVSLVLSREGFYGLINDADNLGVIAAAPYATVKGLRKYRQIDTPKRPEKKAQSEESPKQ